MNPSTPVSVNSKQPQTFHCFLKHRVLIKILSLGACLQLALLQAFAQAVPEPVDNGKAIRFQATHGSFGTYSNPPRLPNGRVDVALLAAQLADLRANTYNFGVYASTNDWEDLQLFLPLARKQGLRVWATLVPPSESSPHGSHYSEPFKLDYERWAIEFARLSVRETNFVAWSIDDFTYNLKFYTPEYLKKMLDAAHQINPRLAFVPCCYFKPCKPEFIKTYAPFFDGILFPYRHESGGANLKDADLVESEVRKLKEMTGAGFPIYIDVYATAHSTLGKSTPEYVEQVMISGKSCADGVLVYCHQNPKLNPEKYQVIKKLFTAWQTGK